MSAKHPYNIQWLSDVEIPLANKFYRKHGFRGKAKRHESCAIVKNKDKQIVACGYLRDYNTFKLLSGVGVDRVFQGQGVAQDNKKAFELMTPQLRDLLGVPNEQAGLGMVSKLCVRELPVNPSEKEWLDVWQEFRAQ